MNEASKLPLSGSCNCGSIEYEVTGPFITQRACHCVQCQKHTQSAYSLVGILAREHFRVVKGELKNWVKTADSGLQHNCWFCPTCGNRIYHDHSDMPAIRLKLGTLDDTSVIRPEGHLWVSMKQDWLELPEGTPTHETQPDIREIVSD